MIKLRNFWVALAMGCAISLGTTSCDDDDDDDQKKEQSDNKKDPDNNNNGGDKTPADTTKFITPEASGEVMKEIVNNIKESVDGTVEGAEALLDQATSMTKEELTNLAATIIEYDRNKDNKEWKETFVKEVGSDKANVILEETIDMLVKEGVDMSEMTPDILVDAFKEFFTPKDEIGIGYEEGFKEGESHKATIEAVYDESFASIPNDYIGLMQMMGVFEKLNEEQQKEFINVGLTWANKDGDEEWKNGFLAGTGLKESDQKALREKLDLVAANKDLIIKMVGAN